jgi:hypothetical protein
MGVRTLLFALAIYILFRILKSRFKRAGKSRALPTYSDTVRCSQCGVRFPSRESNSSNGLNFCSPAHKIEYFEQHGA